MKILQGLARSTQVLDRSSAACGMELSAYDQFYYYDVFQQKIERQCIDLSTTNLLTTIDSKDKAG